MTRALVFCTLAVALSSGAARDAFSATTSMDAAIGGTPDLVSLDPEPGCINATSPCRSIGFDFERADVTPVRGISVTFGLTDLFLCEGEAGIHEGTYLSGHCGGGCTAFLVIDHLDDTYTVDCVILGSECGPDSSGTLFSIDVGSSLSTGTGTIDVLQVLVRDCVNMPVPGLAGDTATLEIDTTAPPLIADLSTVQIKAENGSDETTAIEVTFTDPAASAIEVYRAPHGDGSGASAYPEYDDVGGTPPGLPSYPPAPPWALTAVTVSGEWDEPSDRGYWYYVVFAKDDCANVSPVSNVTGGCLNYHLGDVSDGGTRGLGDNDVGIPDISLIGTHYGIALVLDDPVNYLDVGPTDDSSVNGLPLTDNLVDFEDIILFAINFARVSLTERSPIGTAGSRGLASDRRVAMGGSGSADESAVSDAAWAAPRVLVVADPSASPGRASYLLELVGDPTLVQGIHVVIDGFSQTESLRDGPGQGLEVRPLGIGEGTDVFFRSHDRAGSIVVDVVQLGSGRTFPTSGPFARLVADTELAAAVPKDLVLADVSIRGTRNEELAQGNDHRSVDLSVTWEIPAGERSAARAGDSDAAAGERSAARVGDSDAAAGERVAVSGKEPDAAAGGGNSVTGKESDAAAGGGVPALRQIAAGIELIGARPNPCVRSTDVRFRTAVSGPVRLRIVDIRGRRVRDLVHDFAPPGEHQFTWDGTTSEGGAAASGLYLFELRSGSSTARGRVFLSR